MTVYLALNLICIAFPLIRAFEPKIAFYRKIPGVMFASLTVGLPFLAWDSWAAGRGDWGFSPHYSSSFRFLHLPPEEWLFFVTVPFSTLFLYEVMRFYIRPGILRISPLALFPPAAMVLAAAVFFADRTYTVTVAFAFALAMAAFALPGRKIAMETLTWLFLLVSILPFFAMNSVLTALPVVWYSPGAIIGVRLGTIPIEDFFYSFSMISGWLLSYRYWERRRGRQKQPGLQ
jgi:lycopene cyclase domain-containing protein